MKCPNCGAEHDPEVGGRFCDSCGMSVLCFASTSSRDDEEPKVRTVRCRFCSVATPPPTCVACGNHVPVPDDWDED